MFVLAKRNIVLPNADRTEMLLLHKDAFEDVPEQFTRTAYFAELVNDGKIVVPETRKDKDIETANTISDNVLAEIRKEQQTDPAVKLADGEKKRGRKPKK